MSFWYKKEFVNILKLFEKLTEKINKYYKQITELTTIGDLLLLKEKLKNRKNKKTKEKTSKRSKKTTKKHLFAKYSICHFQKGKDLAKT